MDKEVKERAKQTMRLKGAFNTIMDPPILPQNLNMKIDLDKKRVIPEVVYSVVENLGWDAKDKKQRKVGEITQLQFIDLQSETPEDIVEKTSALLLVIESFAQECVRIINSTDIKDILEEQTK